MTVFKGVRGFRIGAIHWVTPEWGYQTFTLPAKRFTRMDGTAAGSFKLTHTKVWHVQDGERVAVYRAHTATEAKAYIRKRAPRRTTNRRTGGGAEQLSLGGL